MLLGLKVVTAVLLGVSVVVVITAVVGISVDVTTAAVVVATGGDAGFGHLASEQLADTKGTAVRFAIHTP